MTTEQKQFESLMKSVGAQLDQKDVGIVVPVLAAQLANVGIICGISLDDLHRVRCLW